MRFAAFLRLKVAMRQKIYLMGRDWKTKSWKSSQWKITERESYGNFGVWED
jgi:hypothetical protein